MKAYININQKAFNQLSQIKKIKIDLIDATIFEFVYRFSVSNKANKQLIDNKLFIWCSYQKIINDNPLINISSKKAIELRLNKLCKLGLLVKFTDKKLGNKTFFNVTDMAYSLVIENTNLSNENYQGVSKQDSEPLSNEDYYNSKLIDNKLIDNKKIYKKDSDIDYSFEDFWELVPKYHKKDSRKCKLIFDRVSKDEEFPKTFDGIRKSLIPYITKVHFKYPYIKNMTTWLNSGSYADEWCCDTLASEISKQETTPRVRRELEKYVKEFVNNFEQGMQYENEKVI